MTSKYKKDIFVKIKGKKETVIGKHLWQIVYCSLRAQVLLFGPKTYLISASLIGSISGNSLLSLAPSNSLLLRGATMTLACSSTVKLDHLNPGSM